MIDLDDELTEQFLAECREHLDTMETNLRAILNGGSEMAGELASRAFRAAHSFRGAGLFGLVKIRELAQRMEDVLGLIRSNEMIPTPHRVRVLLRANETLHQLIRNPGASNQADIGEIVASLARLCADHQACFAARDPSAAGQPHQDSRWLRVLLVEDDFASRLLLQAFFSRYGDCHIAVNGREAVEAFRSALEEGQKYDLISMDIMMPEMDGREALRKIRALEAAQGILPASGAKIIMTTAVDDMQEVFRCFQELCDAYLLKPIDLAKLLGHMKSYQLVP